MKKNLFFSFLLVACFSATSIAQQEVPRYTFLEMFTSSTCPPCVQGNINLQNMLDQNDLTKGKYTLIKYQMSWPGNGDPYFTTEGGTRRTLYGISGVPNLCMDGSNKQTSFNNTMLLNAQAVPSYLEITGNYTVVGKTVSATINVRPTKDITIGNNLKLYVAIAEKITHNNATTVPNQSNGEHVFKQVMKKFMPDASGTVLGNLTACELVSYDFTWEFNGEYRLPNNALSPINHAIEHSVEDFSNLVVVAWVQNSSNRELYNSCTAIEGNNYAVNFNVSDENKGVITATVGGVPIESGDIVEAGTIVDFVVEPYSNYYLKEWILNRCETVEGNTSNNFSITVDDFVTVTAKLITNYIVNFDVANGNGTLTATIDGVPVGSGDVIAEESLIDFTAIPNDGYIVKEWKLNNNVIPNNTTNNYSLVLSENSTVSVEFMKEEFVDIVSYNVVNGNGTLTATVDGEPFESGTEVKEGATVEFTATPNDGYIVKEWKHNDIIINDNVTNNFSLVVSGNENVTVEFEDISGINVNNLSIVELFPNPVTNELIINNSEHIQKIIISNVLGKTVKEETLSGKKTEVISLQTVQPGIYFVTLKNSEGSEITKKIIKQ